MHRVTALLISVLLVLSFISCSEKPIDREDVDSIVPVPAGKTFYVSPDGSDSNDGSENSPLSTFEGARNAIRSYKKSFGLPIGGIEVVFKTGVYPVTSTIELTAEDSGESGKPIIYRAEKGAEVIFDGGITLDAENFTPANDEIKSMLLSEDAKNALLEIELEAAGCYELDGGNQELFVDNSRQTVARWPNGGYEITELVGGDADEGNAPYLEIPPEKAELWAKSETISYYGYPETDWSASNYSSGNIKIDADKSALIFLRGDYDDTDVSKYFVYNVLSELDEPGEYYWDVEAKKLYYYPDGDLRDKKISFSQFSGNWFVLKDPTFITFEGIIFEHGRGSAIISETEKLNNTNNITVSDCVCRSFGGLFLNLSGSHFSIRNNEIYNMAAGCMWFNGGGLAEQLPSYTVITNNLIHDWSQKYTTSGAAATITGIGYEITHNEIYNSPHKAISMNSGNSVIEYNYIHDVCRETSDAGAIYSGRRWDWSGNIIRYNRIENIIDTTFGGTPCAVYYDDMLSGQYCYGNIFVNIAGTGLTVGGGRNNVIENNIMVNIGKEPVSYDQRAVRDDFGSVFTDYPNGNLWHYITSEVNYLSDYQRIAVPANLLMVENSDKSREYFIDDPGVPSYAIVRGNVTYGSDFLLDIQVDSLEGIDIYKDGISLDAVCHPSAPARLYGTFSTNIKYDSDPGFVDPQSGNYSLSDESRVYRDIPGFPKIDFDRIGIISE